MTKFHVYYFQLLEKVLEYFLKLGISSTSPTLVLD